MTTDAIRSTAFELSRISRILSKMETLSHRKMTPGRAREIMSLYDSLSSFDATDRRLAGSIGVNLSQIVHEGCHQLQATIDDAYDITRAAVA